MKRLLAAALLGAMLLGCSAEPVFEPMEDVYGGTEPMPSQLQVMVPESASVLTAAADGSGQLFFCDGYTMTVQTLMGGDVSRTLRTLTGYEPDSLTVLETQRDGLPCYTCAWISAGECGDQVGRLVLLDDGVWHYAVTVMAEADGAGNLAGEWDRILGSVNLPHTGS